MDQNRSLRRGARGASLVEFALVVPLLSMFLFGIVQFGIAYDTQQSINSAAREGARIGALETATLEDIADRAADSYDASAAAGATPKVVVRGVTSLGVSLTMGVQCSTGAFRASDDCSSNPGGDNIDESDSELMPCGHPTIDYEDVAVATATPYDITIPFLGVQTVTIDAEARFRCE